MVKQGDQIDGHRKKGPAHSQDSESWSPVGWLIDETSIRKRHRYVTVILNGDTGEMLDMIEGRSKAALSRFFIEQAPHGASVKTVVTDPTPTGQLYRYLPGARHVLDRFHAVRWFAQGLPQGQKHRGRVAGMEPHLLAGRFHGRGRWKAAMKMMAGRPLESGASFLEGPQKHRGRVAGMEPHLLAGRFHGRGRWKAAMKMMAGSESGASFLDADPGISTYDKTLITAIREATGRPGGCISSPGRPWGGCV